MRDSTSAPISVAFGNFCNKFVLVIRVFRNQRYKVSTYGYWENQSFQLCGQLFAWSQVHFLWFVQGIAHRTRLRQMPPLWQNQELEQAASGDRDFARILSTAAGLSVGR